MISFLKTHGPKFAPYLVIVLATVAAKHWVVSRANIFLMDDYGLLFRATAVKPAEQFTLLAESVYNNRPFGDFYHYLVAVNWQLNYRLAHAVQLLLHTVNVCLAFYVFRRFAFNLWAALLAALMLAVWPWSTMCVQWTTGIFDLLALTFTVSAVALYAYHLYDEHRVPYFTPALLLLIYVLAVRTKEITITMPALLALEAVYFTLVTGRVAALRRNLAALLPVLAFMAAVVFNHLYLVHSKSTPTTLKPDSLYYLSFHPIALAGKFFEYLLLYCGKRGGGISTFLAKYGLAVVFFMALGAWVFRLWRFAILGVMIFLSLLMILPMVNNLHQLYLYMPSFFIMLLAAALLTPVFERLRRSWLRAGLFVLCAAVVGLCSQHAEKEGFNRDMWLFYAAKDRAQHALFQKKVKRLNGDEKFLIHNGHQDGSIFSTYGPGHSIRLYTGLPKLKIDYLTEKVTDPGKKSAYDVVIDCNGGNFIFEKLSPAKRKVEYLVKF